jgi:hypothetical protein
LHQLLKRALAQTAALWQPIACTFNWLHQVAKILHNEAHLCSDGVRTRLGGLMGAMARWKTQVPTLITAVEHFLKVTRSYWAGLFHCYDIEGLPRTNNDLEQTFGKWRHHQRRCSGQKIAPATAVTRGSVQLLSALATQQRTYSASDLATVPQGQWQQLRSTLQQHQQKRVQQRQFRRSPASYLAQLEQKLLQLTLPP